VNRLSSGVDAEWTGVQPARDPGAGLVEVGDLGPAQQVTDPLHKPAQPPAPSAASPASIPTDTLAPSTSPSTRAARSTGT
jgi:hypothetical protein